MNADDDMEYDDDWDYDNWCPKGGVSAVVVTGGATQMVTMLHCHTASYTVTQMVTMSHCHRAVKVRGGVGKVENKIFLFPSSHIFPNYQIWSPREMENVQ